MSKKIKTPEAVDKTYQITAATIKDDLCDYNFEVISGVGIGDNHKVKGRGIIDEDLRYALSDLNVHLAAIDDAFKNMKQDDFDAVKKHERATLYQVTGFTIKGSEENEIIVLRGSKHVSASGDRMELETPRIPLDENSSYKWKKQLKKAADKVREEVAEYKEGKCTAQEVEPEKDANQLSISENDLDGGKV